MDNNDSNTKPQQTGGLKLMTVFISVLALHVVVIGGFTVYHLMSGGSTDADLVSVDKSKKDLKSTDSSSTASTTTPDASQPDKTAPTTPSTATSTDVATAAATAPATDATTGPNEIVTPTPGPAPTLQPTPVTAPPVATTPAPLTLSPSDLAEAGKLAPLAPLTSDLAPSASAPLAPDATLAPSPLTSSMASGPVHMPPPAKAPSPTHVDGQVYTVKITDSYKKIASAHHITVAQLKAANHIRGDTLHTGQKLLIPSGKMLVATTAPAASLEATPVTPMTSSLTETAPSATATLAETPAYAGTTASAAPHEHLYTVVKGDTLSKIAHKFKTTAAAIMTENNITDPTKLSIGKKLRIPSRESRSAGNAVPVAAPLPPQAQPQPQAPAEAMSDDTSAQLANFRSSSPDSNF